MFQHRHYVFIAQTIAELGNGAAPVSKATQETVAHHFGRALQDTNPNFDHARFIAAAMGRPINGRDK